LLASVLCFIAVFFLGFLGTVAAGRGALSAPSIAFFGLLRVCAHLVFAMFLVLGVALVCSCFVTLQLAVIAVVSRVLTDSWLDLVPARCSLFASAPLAIVLAWYSAAVALRVFRLFFVAVLFAAATVFPVFLSFSARIPADGGFFGAVFGFFSVVICGSSPSDLQAGLKNLSIPVHDVGLANKGEFLSALLE
jgi:hypothetical protein